MWEENGNNLSWQWTVSTVTVSMEGGMDSFEITDSKAGSSGAWSLFTVRGVVCVVCVCMCMLGDITLVWLSYVWVPTFPRFALGPEETHFFFFLRAATSYPVDLNYFWSLLRPVHRDRQDPFSSPENSFLARSPLPCYCGSRGGVCAQPFRPSIMLVSSQGYANRTGSDEQLSAWQSHVRSQNLSRTKIYHL